MKEFYILSRDEHGFTWKPMKGDVVKNDFGLSMFVYHSKELIAKNGKSTWWYVVEESTGLSVTKGGTKKEAVENALAMKPTTVAYIRNAITRQTKKNGYPPNYVPMSGYDIMDGWDDNASWLHREDTVEAAEEWCREHLDTHPTMIIVQQTEDGNRMFVEEVIK